MDIENYAWKASKTRGDMCDLNYLTLGLNGEAGEVADQVKRIVRDDGGMLSDERRGRIMRELGDVAWYWSQCCLAIGVSPSMVLDVNLAKLADRAKRSKIGGDGDER